MLKSDDVILTIIQFANTFDVKTRPAVILFEKFDNFVVAGVTSNKSMKGICLTKKEGAVKDSVIKLNYIFTISKTMIEKTLFSLTKKRKKLFSIHLLKN